MGTMALKRLQRRLRGYLLQQPQISVPIFFVTTTDRRAGQILAATAQEAHEVGANPTLLFVTTQEHVRSESVLGASIWQQAGKAQPVSILPSSTPTTSRDTGVVRPVTPSRVESPVAVGQQ